MTNITVKSAEMDRGIDKEIVRERERERERQREREREAERERERDLRHFSFHVVESLNSDRFI